jgi:hypothetical protein
MRKQPRISLTNLAVPAIVGLSALLDPVVATAVEACRAARDSAIEAEEARRGAADGAG